MTTQDYYKILNVSKDSHTAQIKTAYRDLAFQFHPDKNKGNPEAAEKMKLVNEAYAVLSDPEKKRDYDALLNQYGSADAHRQFRNQYTDQDIFTGTDIHKVFDELAQSFGFRSFDDIFRELYGTKGNRFEVKGSNFSLKGFFFLGTLNIGKFPFKTDLPVKIARLARVLLRNTAGERIGQQGRNLHDSIQINPDLAEKGGPYAYYHTWQSKKLVVTIPPHIRHGQQIRLKGMGEQGQGGGKPGDLYLTIETRPSLVSKIRKYLPF